MSEESEKRSPQMGHCERLCDKIEAQQKTAPGGATNTICPGPDHCEGVAEMSVTAHHPEVHPAGSDHKSLALFYCAEAHQRYRHNYMQRIHFARLARQYGATNQEIADRFEATEAAVRMMLKRSKGD